MRLPDLPDYGPLSSPWWKQWLSILQRIADTCLGPGQSWQTVTGGRALNATHTNTTGRTIEAKVTIWMAGANYLEVDEMVNSRSIAHYTVHLSPTMNPMHVVDIIVPPGNTYGVNAAVDSGSMALYQWSELR